MLLKNLLEYSVSIPLNIKEAKWDFINDKKGERDIELIQKEPELKDENE